MLKLLDNERNENYIVIGLLDSVDKKNRHYKLY